LPTLWSFDHVELHLLAFLQTAKAVRLDCREMHKNIVAALTADEPVALGTGWAMQKTDALWIRRCSMLEPMF
jgi:hypothetical protein